jgi:CHAD domain-containing protein
VKKNHLFQRNFASLKSFEKVLNLFREKYDLKSQTKSTIQRRYFDTFDWRLLRQGYVFEFDNAESGRCRLRSFGRQGLQISSELKQEPDFSWNFTCRTLREMLIPVIEERRLIAQDEVQVSIVPYELMDDQGKILLRFDLEKYLRPDSIGRLRSAQVNCRFYPLKGYEKICERLLKLLDGCADEIKSIDDPLIFVLSMHDREPTDYSSKLNVSLHPQMSIGQAMATTLLFHLDMVKKNIPGIKADLDTEFLHDFRIANRRGRSLVSAIKHVIPNKELTLYKKMLSMLSDVTSENRDLDVFLLDIPHYQSMLPLEMRDDLEPLRKALSDQRQDVHKRLLKVLTSKKFNGFQSEFQTFLSTALKDHFKTEQGAQPVSTIARQAIWRIYRRLLKQGRIASRTGNREALHDLRKTGKKLRYLLETFRSLFSKEEIDRVIADCRKLQKLLGQIVDYRVQQNYLLGWVNSSNNKAMFPDATIVCIKHLVETYKELEEKAYGKFQGRYEHFSSSKTKQHFKALSREKS